MQILVSKEIIWVLWRLVPEFGVQGRNPRLDSDLIGPWLHKCTYVELSIQCRSWGFIQIADHVEKKLFVYNTIQFDKNIQVRSRASSPSLREFIHSIVVCHLNKAMGVRLCKVFRVKYCATCFRKSGFRFHQKLKINKTLQSYPRYKIIYLGNILVFALMHIMVLNSWWTIWFSWFPFDVYFIDLTKQIYNWITHSVNMYCILRIYMTW